MKILGAYTAGDLPAYLAAGREMRARLEELRGEVLIAHHGDCDGITGGALLARFLGDRGARLRFASCAEFRLKDLDYFAASAEGCDGAVFVEAQGMTPEYARLDPKFLNIDHHPHPPETPIRRMFNPRAHGIAPNPAIGLVMFELLSDALPPEASWLAALASIVDYCPDPAADLIRRHAVELERLDDLRDTFLASQYMLPFTTALAEFLSTLPSPEELLEREPFAARRRQYRELLAAAIAGASIGEKIVRAETAPAEIRIASPLANRLQDLNPEKCVVVIENSINTARFSVRLRSARVHLGETLGAIAREIGAGDGTGHEKAGSARVPAEMKERFLMLLEERIG